MSKFALKKINSIVGKQSIEKLVVDDYCQYDNFITELKKTRKGASKVASLYAIIKDYADCKSLPDTKFRFLHSSANEKVKEIEFKKDDIRIYGVKKDNGAILILGGYKNRQKKDLRTFRSLKEKYIASL
jgi:hypothetical protein